MGKDLNYWKNNAEEDYMKVPISVLRYITELEKVVLPQADVVKSVFVVCENDNYGRDLWLCCKNTFEEAKEVKGRDRTRNIYEHWIL